ncbi:MAG: GNAT family N-acetyltransferase [Thermoplasmata archaeon]
MAETKEPFEYRLLRRPDVPSYIDLVLLTVGKLERSTGLDRNAESMIRSLSRRSVWAVLSFLQLIGRPFVTTYVAADGNRIVGTGTLLSLPNAGYVAAMATAPEFRGRGVASRILTLLHKEAARRHRDWLVLDVDSDNDTAIRVYRRAGYREVARFAWYLRTGPPPTTAPVAPGTPPATKAQLKAVAPSLDAGRAAEYRAALPASARRLTHMETLLVSGRRVRRETWVRHSVNGAPLAIRAGFAPEPPTGVYYPLTGPTAPTAEEVAALFDPATEWLRPLAPATCLAVVPEPAGAVGAELERLGFTGVASSTTMIRSSSA